MTTPNTNESPSIALPPSVKVTASPKKPKDDRASPRPEPLIETLAERGASLPIGQAGARWELVARNWTTRYERELSKSSKGRSNMARRVSLVVATLFKKFGPHVWDDDTDIEDRKAVLSKMYSADMFYAYCFLRREALGEELKLKIRCGSCRKEFEWLADLDTLEIHSPKEHTDLFWTYTLRNPVDLRGVHVEKFRIGPQRWSMLENNIHDVEKDMGAAKISGVCSSICGFNDDAKDIELGPNELDDVSKYDFEYILSELNVRFWGPKMGVELECVECKTELVQMIPWDYNDFFSISSQ
jgi:hypothetical protein